VHFGPEWANLFPCWNKLNFIWGKGHEGIPLFYILSGFILSHVYQPSTFELNCANLKIFIRHRLIRIYPLYLFCLLFLGFMVVGCSFLHLHITGKYGLSSFIYNLFLLQVFDRPYVSTWNYPSWTVSVEWFAYLFAFPAGCLMLQNRFLKNPLISAITICFLIAAYLASVMTWNSAMTNGIANGYCLFFGRHVSSFICNII
jgi:peptidoglycan/LPS O-acetylase OafA/YrhL